MEPALAQRFDLVLMDCQMPPVDGPSAAMRIRKWEAARRETKASRCDAARLPIVALTANAFDEDRERCLASGKDGLPAKPVTADELGAVIARWRPERPAPSAPVASPVAP